MVVLFDLELEPQTKLKMVTKITKLWCVSCPLFPFHTLDILCLPLSYLFAGRE